MNRFALGQVADHNLSQVSDDLQHLSDAQAIRIARDLQRAFAIIAQHPFLGLAQSELTRRVGEQARSRVARPYRIDYVVRQHQPESLAILHGAQNVMTILRERHPLT